MRMQIPDYRLLVVLLVVLLFLTFFKKLTNKIRKYKFNRTYRKKLNKDNPYKLTLFQRVGATVEKKVVHKFFLAVTGILLSISIIDFSYSLFIESFNFLILDNNSARYFFSTVAQSLAALFAISFTVLLIYLQISSDKYSIQTVKFVFEGWGGIIVISSFLITIIFSIFHLGNINDFSGVTFYSGSGAFVVFSLLVFCSISLIGFYYRVILNLIPENFIKNSGYKIRKTFVQSLDFVQELRIRKLWVNECRKNFNIERSFFAEGKHPIKTVKRGFVSDIDVLKLEKAGRLLLENPVSDEKKNRVILTAFIESRLEAEENILGYVEHPEGDIREEICELIRGAYKTDKKRLYLLDSYQELIPLASITIKAIKELEKGIFEYALEEFTEIGIDYLKARKSFSLMPEPEQTEGIKLGRHFFDEWIGHVEKMLDEALKQDDNDIVDNVIYKMRNVGIAAIEIQDLDAFKQLSRFFYYSFYRSLSYENHIGQERVLLYLKEWFFKLKYDLEKEETDYQYIKNLKFFFVETIKTSRSIVKLLIDKEDDKFIIKALARLIAFLPMAYSGYATNKYELEYKKSKLSEDSEDYAEIENKLRIIELKEELENGLKKIIFQKLFILGAYVMVRLEEDAVDVRFSSKIFKELNRNLKEENLEQIFDSHIPFHFGEEESWFMPDRDEEAHFVEMSYVSRFYLLFCSYQVKNGGKLEHIKPVDYFTENQIKEFEKEFSKLEENIETWDAIFGDTSKKYLKQVIIRLKECQKEQKEKIRERVRKADLATERVEKVKKEIIQHAKKSMIARAFVKVEEVLSAPEEDFVYNGINMLYDKIFFVEDVDRSTHYGYEQLGNQLGRSIGMGETNFIVEKIYTVLNKTKNIVNMSEFSLEMMDNTVKKLDKRGIKGGYVLLVGHHFISKIWELPEFKSRRITEEENAPYGYLGDIEVYLIRTPDENVAILLNRDNIGTLSIKEKLKADITTEFDKEELIKRKKEEESASKDEIEKYRVELEEKVNIKALERIKFDIENDEAGLILRFKTTI